MIVRSAIEKSRLFDSFIPFIRILLPFLLTISFSSISFSQMSKELSNMENQNISIEKDHIEQVFNEMMDNIEDGNLKTMLKSKFEMFKKEFNGELIEYSFRIFITAELDFRTSGDRGLGRVSEQIPRFGGYYRKQLSRIGQGKIIELYNLIHKIMLRAYLTGVLMLSEDLEKAAITNEQELFERWIPNIYVTPFNSLGSGLQNALLAFCGSSVEGFLSFLEMNQIKRKGFLKREKINEIIS